MLFESAESTILFWLCVGAATMFVILAHSIRSPKGTTGMPLALLLSLAMVHLAAGVHLIPGYFHQYDGFLNNLGYTRNSVAKGLQVSTIGFVMMAAGIWLASHLGAAYRLDLDQRRMPARFLRLAERTTVLAGLLFFYGVTFFPWVADIPTLGAVIVSGKNLLIVGLCMAILRRTWLNEGMTMLQIGLLAVSMPIANLLGNAILADSVTAIVIIGSFWIAIAGRQRGVGRILIGIVAASYVFLFLATNYMLVRTQFRDIVWEPSSTLDERIDGLVNAVGQFGPLSSDDQKQLYVLDARLNQSLFTGMAVEKLAAQPDSYDNGSTLLAGLFAFVPRVIWADKPVRGGSEYLAEHTGYRANAATTYGIGPFFEFYTNFALGGVIFFSLLFGMLIRYLDLRAIRALATGRMQEGVPLMIAMVALIQPLAMMSAVFSAFYASIIIGLIMVKILERYLDIRIFTEEQARSRLV